MRLDDAGGQIEEAADDIDLMLDRLAELSGLECNGVADLISYELGEAGIEHYRMCGSVRRRATDEVVFPHCWVELADGTILDVRLRMYFPFATDVPHGWFSEPAEYHYQGTHNPEPRLPTSLLRELS